MKNNTLRQTIPRTTEPIRFAAQAALERARRLGLPFKFAATGLLFLLPLALLLIDFQNEINRSIRVAELERAGVAYSRPLTTFLLDVSQGGRSIKTDLAAVDQADRENGDTLGGANGLAAAAGRGANP